MWSNGIVVLSAKDVLILTENKGGALEEPEKVSQVIVDSLLNLQRNAPTRLTLRADSLHAECVTGFEPELIQETGVKTVIFNFEPNESKNCTFVGWTITKNDGVVNLGKDPSEKTNKVTVNGAQGELVAHFLFPGENLPSSTQLIASSIVISSSVTSSSESNTSSSGIETKSIKIEGIDYFITKDDTIEYHPKRAAGAYIVGWDSLAGVKVSWHPGADSIWDIIITYNNYKSGSVFNPTYGTLAAEQTGPAGTFPARLYPTYSDYTLLMANSGDWVGLSQVPFSSSTLLFDSELKHTFLTGHTPVGLGSRLDQGFCFSSFTHNNKVSMVWSTGIEYLYSYFDLTIIGSVSYKGISLVSSPELVLGATNISPNGNGQMAAGLTNSLGKSVNIYYVDSTDKIIQAGIADSTATLYLTDISIALGDESTKNFMGTVEYQPTGENKKQRILLGDVGGTPYLSSLPSDGTLWAIIPSSNNTFLVFGNEGENKPTLYKLFADGSVLKNYTLVSIAAMEYTGGRELSNGNIIAWGSATGSRKGTPSHSTTKGIVTLYNSNLSLIWSQYIDMVPFDVYPSTSSGFLVAGFEAVGLGSVYPSKIIFMGPHGEQ